MPNFDGTFAAGVKVGVMMMRQLVIRGAAVSVAAIAVSVFAAGEFMGDRPLQPTGTVSGVSPDVRGASLVGGATAPSRPEMDGPALEFTALDTDADIVAAPNVQNDIVPDLVLADGVSAPEQEFCPPVMTARPAIDGLIDLQLAAPCNANERVVIGHGDLAFAVRLDAAGEYSAYIPALSAQVSVDAYLQDDTYLVATAQVPEFDDHARMVVQWTGVDAMSLHAFHSGAQFGEAGHLHASNPFDPNLEEAFLVTLGDPTVTEPMLAQVYSVPLSADAKTRLQLEVASVPGTCGMDLTAFVMPTHGPNAGTVQDLNVAMPGCDQGGGFAVIDLPFDLPEPDLLALTADQSG
jgi:hypothetical protein